MLEGKAAKEGLQPGHRDRGANAVAETSPTETARTFSGNDTKSKKSPAGLPAGRHSP